jgi:transposase InsO family protein
MCSAAHCDAGRASSGGGGPDDGASSLGPTSVPSRRAGAGGLVLPPQPAAVRDGPVIEALQQVVQDDGRWGFWKYFDRLRLLGHRWNHKRVWRVYRALRLNLPRRTRRRVPPRVRQPLIAPLRTNAMWAMDFMHDALYGGRRFRTLNVLNEGNREALAIEVGPALPSGRVIRVLEQLIALYGPPAALRLDNGPELTAQAFHGLVPSPPDRRALHPTGQADAERLHRTLQPYVPRDPLCQEANGR